MSGASRVFPRYEVNAYVDYAGSDVYLYHKISNISLGGICLETPTLEEVGTEVDVVVNFPDLDRQLSLRGEVVWSNKDEPRDMGIRWVGLDGDTRVMLREYLDMVATKQTGESGPEPNEPIIENIDT